MEVHASAGQRESGAVTGEQAHGGHGAHLRHGAPPEQDPSLQHPRCVFQLLKRHYRRYTPELVAELCGCTAEEFVSVAEALCSNSGRERTSAICYAVGWTQHTVGVQNIRAAAIVQLLLGNIGRPGGGILALRGHASIQGSTDIPTLYNILPGYIPMPHAHAHDSLERFLELNTAPSGFWGNMQTYTISLLKAWWGEHAHAGNEYCFDYLPRSTGDHSDLPGRPRDAGRRRARHARAWVRTRPSGRPTRACIAGRWASSTGWSCATWSRSRRRRSGARARGGVRRAPDARRSGPRCSSCRRPRTSRRRAASRTRSGSCSGATRRSSRRATAAPSCGSRITSGGSSGRSWRPRPTARRPLQRLQWHYPTVGEHAEPDADAVLREINGCGRRRQAARRRTRS